MITYTWKTRDEFYVDTAAELSSWDVSSLKMGAKAYVIETKKQMILNGNGEWVEYSCGGSGSGGGSSSSLPAVTAADNGKVLIVKDGAWAVDFAPAIVGSDDSGE